jgi:hypothetical protein
MSAINISAEDRAAVEKILAETPFVKAGEPFELAAALYLAGRAAAPVGVAGSAPVSAGDVRLVAAMKEAVRLGVFPRFAEGEEYLRKWGLMQSILSAALAQSTEQQLPATKYGDLDATSKATIQAQVPWLMDESDVIEPAQSAELATLRHNVKYAIADLHSRMMKSYEAEPTRPITFMDMEAVHEHVKRLGIGGCLDGAAEVLAAGPAQSTGAVSEQKPVARITKITSASGTVEALVFLEEHLKVGAEFYAAPQATSVPSSWRELMQQLAECDGGMVNGNKLAAKARELLAATPPGDTENEQ